MFNRMSSYQNRKSSAVKGCPSLHFIPFLSQNVRVLASALHSYFFATLGTKEASFHGSCRTMCSFMK